MRWLVTILTASLLAMAATTAAQDSGPEPEPTVVQEPMEERKLTEMPEPTGVPEPTKAPEPAEAPEPGETDSADPDMTEPVSPETVSPQAQPEAAPIEPSETLPPEPSATPQAEEPREPFAIIGQQLEPGELRQFNWQQESAMAGLAVPTPVLVAHGREPGPTLCLVAAVHGDELNGVEIVRRIMFGLNLDRLAGNVVGVPIANAFGFLSRSRYLPDRRDLNRHFPGTVGGSLASRFAYALFNEVITRCEVLVDIHTGSFHRTNLPQLRADLTIGPVLNLTKQFGDIAVLHDMSPTGSLRRAATDVGIAAVTMETGGPGNFENSAVDTGVKAIEALLNHLGMIRRFRLFGDPQPVFYESTWVRAESGGILLSDVRLGAVVAQDQVLGTVTDPIQNKREFLKAPFRGRILGMAVNQVVMPGFAAFHIGRVASEPLSVDTTTRDQGLYDGDDFDTEDDMPANGGLFEMPAYTTGEPAPEQVPTPQAAPQSEPVMEPEAVDPPGHGDGYEDGHEEGPETTPVARVGDRFDQAPVDTTLQ
jgi:uncharacterized protein